MNEEDPNCTWERTFEPKFRFDGKDGTLHHREDPTKEPWNNEWMELWKGSRRESFPLLRLKTIDGGIRRRIRSRGTLFNDDEWASGGMRIDDGISDRTAPHHLISHRKIQNLLLASRAARIVIEINYHPFIKIKSLAVYVLAMRKIT